MQIQYYKFARDKDAHHTFSKRFPRRGGNSFTYLSKLKVVNHLVFSSLLFWTV